MRAIPLLLSAAVLTGCATQPPSPTELAEAQAQFQKLTAGKVPGQPISCLPSYRRSDMVTIDDSTIAFKAGRTVYINKLLGECSGLKSGFNTLVTTSSGPGMCRGDIARVADVRTGMTYGSCAIGDFTPYKPAA